MNYFVKTFIFIFLISFLPVSILAQDTQRAKYENEIPESKKCNLSDDYENFNQVEFREFTLCIPIELKVEKVKCIDGGCYTFESENMILDIDTTPNAGTPVLERTYPTYQENYIQVDNKKVWLWFFEQNYKYKYFSGANFQSGKHKYYDLGLFVFYKDSAQKVIAEKIIKSVRFKLIHNE